MEYHVILNYAVAAAHCIGYTSNPAISILGTWFGVAFASVCCPGIFNPTKPSKPLQKVSSKARAK